PDALRLLREPGLRAEDVDVLVGASGGPKWLVLRALDRFLFGEVLQAPRDRPLHLIGSSIGAWRMACLARRDPVAALGRLEEAYLGQRYEVEPTPREVTAESLSILDRVLGEDGADEILSHPWARLHVVTTACRGPLASERRTLQMLGLAAAACANVVSRRTLALQMSRVIFHSAGDASPFLELDDMPTTHVALTRGNLRHALLASGSIPLVLEGVRIPDAPGVLQRDGGIVDYHLDLAFGPGDGIVLYPHFFPHVVPGWFDKALGWRRGRPENFRRALIIAPSEALVARLPDGRIPDRKDFYRMDTPALLRRWRVAMAESEAMADELRELMATGRVAEVAVPW
ncbi:MAG: patatin-like phospholipase family protein, partial [Gemmatimonadota bacterium]